MKAKDKMSLLYLTKADQDRLAVRALMSHAEISGELIGFHAQQSVEKLLKAVLCYREIDFPHVHNLAVLMDLLGYQGLDMPAELREALWLTPYAVEYRYDYHDSSDPPFDSEQAARCVDSVRAWAFRVLPWGAKD